MKMLVWTLRIAALVLAIIGIILSSVHAATAEVDEILLGVGLAVLVCSTFIKPKD